MTIANDVRSYLRNKPYLLEALEKGIVNLSELSRQIQGELKTSNTSAVKAALRRFAEDLQRHKQKREEKVLHVLKRSGIAVYDRKSVMITNKEIEVLNLQLITYRQPMSVWVCVSLRQSGASAKVQKSTET